MFDVITMGSATVDAFASTDNELIKIESKTMKEELIAYPLGSKIVITELRYNTGGNGVNAAVALSKLGLKAGFAGKIGTDANGQMIMKTLGDNNVEFIGAVGEQSGFSVILDSVLANDRTILTYKGDNNNLHFVDLDQEKLHAKWFYLSSMLKDSFHTMEKVADLAKTRGAKIAFNPSATIAKKGTSFLANILKKTYLLILNDEEAEYLVGKGTVDEKLRKLHDMGISIIVITMGKDGVKASDGKTVFCGHPKPDREIVETTGAGDSFASTFVAGCIMEKNIETCIRMGMINAESVITHPGAQNKLLTIQEIEEKLAHDERKYHDYPLK